MDNALIIITKKTLPNSRPQKTHHVLFFMFHSLEF